MVRFSFSTSLNRLRGGKIFDVEQAEQVFLVPPDLRRKLPQR